MRPARPPWRASLISRDVSEEDSAWLCQRCADENRELPDSLQQLCRASGRDLGRADAAIRVIKHEAVAQMTATRSNSLTDRPSVYFYVLKTIGPTRSARPN